MLYPQNSMMPMNSQNMQMQRQQNGFVSQNSMNGIQNMPVQQQQYIPSPQQTNFFVKIVDSIESVKIADVPMDGNSYIFPKADGSEIYTKRWLPNFTTDVSTYVKVGPEVSMVEEKKGYSESTFGKKEFEEMSEDLFDKFSTLLDERISKIEKQSTNNNQRQQKS